MPARISESEAKRLGIDTKPRTRTRTTRKTAKGPWHTVCTTCDLEFRTEASETRHVNETKHARYRLVLGN